MSKELPTASMVQEKVYEYKNRLLQNHINNHQLSATDKKYKLFIIDIGLEIMEYVLCDFTLKLSNDLKILKQRISIYTSIIATGLSLFVPAIFNWLK